MLRNMRSKLIQYVGYSKFLAFGTFLSRQTNLKNTSSVLFVKYCLNEEILDGKF